MFGSTGEIPARLPLGCAFIDGAFVLKHRALLSRIYECVDISYYPLMLRSFVQCLRLAATDRVSFPRKRASPRL